ncbi:MAG: gamma-glutamyltransferase [Chloroflexota bacterium]
MKGLVVCPQPRAAEEGSKILAKGGNAIDAAVATAFVQHIVNPTMTGVAGSGSMLIHIGKTGETRVIDFYARAGSKTTPEMWQDKIVKLSGDQPILAGNLNVIGYTSVGVPGVIKGLHDALTKYGTMSWKEVIEPAIPYAEIGTPMDTALVGTYTRAPSDYQPPSGPLLTADDVLKATLGSEKIWYKPDGSSYALGELRANKDYARTLRRLRDEGADSFYTGSIAKDIAKDMEKHGGHITANDLKNYKTRMYAPIEGSYRGYKLLVNRPPGCGVLLLELLKILEGYPLDKMHRDSLEYNWLWVQALRAAHSDRVQYLGDEEFTSVPVDMLLSKERADYWRKKIDAEERIVVPTGQLMPTHTTHLCVLDEAGNAVTMTHSNASNSGCVTEGLGFIYNNWIEQFYAVPGLPNSIAPGKAPQTSLVPSLLFKDGKLTIIIGAPGGFAIPGSVAQCIVNLIDHGMSMEEAVSAPRLRCLGGLIELEARIRIDVAEGLRRKGNPVRHWPDGYTSRVALVHGIRIDLATGKWQGGADPRGNGGVAFSYA